jgi:hypothetical protein
MKTSFEIKEAMDGLYAEIEAIHAMPEEEVCIRYNVDTRDEILLLINDELSVLSDEYDRALEREEEEEQLLMRKAACIRSTPMASQRLAIELGFIINQTQKIKQMKPIRTIKKGTLVKYPLLGNDWAKVTYVDPRTGQVDIKYPKTKYVVSVDIDYLVYQ